MNATSPELAAIVVAAGVSRRMGFDKLLAPLGGRPLIAYSLSAFNDCPDVDHVVLVCAEDRLEEFRSLSAEFPKVRTVVAGGKERVESVLAGTAAFGEPRPIFVAVHDGARPLITAETVSACYQAACEFGASVSAEPVIDTLHRVDNQLLTTETVSRKNLWRMQTPQILELAVLESLLQDVRDSGGTITDEISLLIRSGGRARVVENPDWNIKVTYPRDLELVQMILEWRGRSG
ncbi:MAG TPA: 2-C-methyl-D-erythritol 4-phosphate cytidylyltransferase [Terrimicrobiaceae bacterium]